MYTISVGSQWYIPSEKKDAPEELVGAIEDFRMEKEMGNLYDEEE